jgi:uroporphyrin-III C-methyltransferase
MGLTHLDEIARRMMEAGRPADDKVAIISKATTPDQRILVSTLGECAREAKAAGIEPPAIVAMGEVVGLHSALDWFKTREN